MNTLFVNTVSLSRSAVSLLSCVCSGVPLIIWTRTPRAPPRAPPTAPWHPEATHLQTHSWGSLPQTPRCIFLPSLRQVPQSLFPRAPLKCLQPPNPSSALLFCQSGQQDLSVLLLPLKRLRLVGELCSLWVRFDCSGRGEGPDPRAAPGVTQQRLRGCAVWA